MTGRAAHETRFPGHRWTVRRRLASVPASEDHDLAMTLRRRLYPILVVMVLVSACAAHGLDAKPTAGGKGTSTTRSESSGTAVEEVSPDPACAAPTAAVGWSPEASAKAVVVAEGSDTSPRVEAVVYPHPDYEGNPWSQWGQGLVLDDGRHLSAIGDHLGRDGNAYLYEYDPETTTLTQIADVLGIVDHTSGDWGYGKVHAQMVPGPCGNVLVTTYWGSRRDIEFNDRYQGDVLLSIDPQQRTTAALGVVYSEHGVPSLAASPDRQLLYAEAVDPLAENAGSFVVLDAHDGRTIYVDDDAAHIGFRSIAVDASGRAFYSAGGGGLAVYDPASNASTRLEAKLPGEWLRAATRPDARGTVYGVTMDPDVFFALDPDGSIRTLTEALDYTTSVALSGDGTTLYSVPAAHGQAWKIGAPLMAVDTATGDQRTVIELQPLVGQRLGMRLGGTYNVAFDKERNRIYLGMNASGNDDDSGFGEVVLLVVTLP